MKKSIIFLMCILFVLGSFVDAGEMPFEDFKKLIIKDVVPARFTLDKSMTSGSKFFYRVEFKGDQEKAEMISISLHSGIDKFNEMDKAGKPESYDFKDRSTLYADGNKVGMTTFSMILNNKKGKFSISHRVFGGKFLSRAELEKMVEKIGLENLEK